MFEVFLKDSFDFTKAWRLIGPAIVFPSSSLSGALATLAAALTAVLIWYECWRRQLWNPAFDGPSGWPILGNLLDLWFNGGEQCRRWSALYGDVFQVQVGERPALVVNSAAAAKTIFIGNSQAVSSRPHSYTLDKILAPQTGHALGTASFDEALPRNRKLASAQLSKPAVRNYIDHLDAETRDFVNDCCTVGRSGLRPFNPLPLLQRVTLSMDLTLCWGRRVALDDELLYENMFVERELLKLRHPMRNLQDCFSFIQYIPLNPWRQTAYRMRERRKRYLKQLNHELDEQMRQGISKPCIRADMIQRGNVDEEDMKVTSNTYLSAGTTPMSVMLQWCIALLAQRPDIQSASFKAIQEHYGTKDSLGDKMDDEGCQYIVALGKECLRFFTPSRMTLPHSTTKDIEFRGKYVPRGTTILLNAWACNRDPELWADPDTFDPLRWMTAPNAPIFTYGLGLPHMSRHTACKPSPISFPPFEILAGSNIDVNPITGIGHDDDTVSSPVDYTVVMKPRDVGMLQKFLELRPEPR